MRVNIEDELRLSGRLGRLARAMRWNERETVGALALFWGATQDAEIIEAPLSRIITVVAAHFDSDGQAESFVRAMAAARLATGSLDGASFLIHGNEPHVLRLRRLRRQATNGGFARAKAQNEDSPMESLPVGSLGAALTQPDQSAPTPTPTPKKTADTSTKRKRTKQHDPQLLAIVERHRQLLQQRHGIEPSSLVSDGTIAQAKKIFEELPDRWEPVLDAFTKSVTPWLKQYRWPLSSLIRFIDDYDARAKNQRTTKTTEQIEAEDAAYQADLARRDAEAMGVP